MFQVNATGHNEQSEAEAVVGGKTTYTVVQYQVKMLLVLLTTLHLLDEFVMFIDEQIK